jgi:hypothetical protein
MSSLAAARVRLAGPVLLGLAPLARPRPALAAPIPPVAGINPFSWVKDQVLGGLEWGVDQAGGFVTNLLAGIADALIPDWLAREALGLVGWMVAIPNYAAEGTNGGYAFAGLNSLRGTLTWVGVTLVPLTLTLAIGRATLGLGSDHPVAPLTRALSAVALVLLYPFVWAQIAGGANHLTRAVLRIPAVESGLNEQFEFMVGGGALKGAPFLGALMLLVAGALLVATLVLKLMILVAGAVLYVTGVLMPGIAATERGQAVAQAWITATVGLMAIPVIWTVVFAVGALLMHDADTAARAVAGSGRFRELIGGLMLAVGSIAASAVALKIATTLGGVIAGQVTGALALVGSRDGGQRTALRAAASGAGTKLAAFGTRLGGAMRQVAGDNLVGRTRTGALAALAGGGAVASGGLIGAAGLGGRRTLAAGARAARRVAHRAPAGVVASRIAQSARQGWANPTEAPRWEPPSGGPPADPPPAGRGASTARDSRTPPSVGSPPTTAPPPKSSRRQPSSPDAVRPASHPPQTRPSDTAHPPRRDDPKGGGDGDVPPTR